jgi:hypothetical protein
MGTLFKSFSEEIPKDSIWADLLSRKPSQKDFSEQRVAIRKDIRDTVLDYLKNKHFCIIVGSRDIGKTWLCYTVGFFIIERWKRSEEDIWFTTVNLNFNADEAWGFIKSLKGRGKAECFLIIEDCYKNPDEVESLLERILQESEENLRFLFTLRKAGRNLLKDDVNTFNDLSEEKDCVIDLLPKFPKEDRIEVRQKLKEHVIDIIKKFIKVKNVEELQISERELESTAEDWGHDLYWVQRRLKVWEYQKGQRLSEIKEDDVLNSIRSGEINLENPRRRKILLYISALCQFEPLLMWEDFLEKQNIDSDILSELKREGVIEAFRWNGLPFLSIPESDAEDILKALSHFYRYNIQQESKRIFTEYLKSQPPNCASVFMALHMARKGDRGSFAKEIFVSLLQNKEAWEMVKEAGKQGTLWEIKSILEILRRDGEQQKAQNIWSCYVVHKGVDQVTSELVSWEISGIKSFLYIVSQIDRQNCREITEKLNNFFIELKEKFLKASATTQSKFYSILYRLNPFLSQFLLSDRDLYEDLQRKLKSSTASNIRQVLNPLAKIVHLDEFFNTFSSSDWTNIINLSKLNTIRLLLTQDFLKWYKLSDTPKALVKGLLNANLGRLISQKESTLHQLTGLLYTVEQVDISAAMSLIDNLSQQDLNKMISQANCETIMWFLAKVDKLNHASAQKIVNKVNGELWGRTIRSASLEKGFWVLWNLYRASPTRAQFLVQNNIGQYFLQSRIYDKLSTNWLALLGLLCLCNFEIHNILPPGINAIAVKQKLEKESSPTLLILSLIALKVALSLEQSQGIREILDVEPIKDRIINTPDSQLRILFQSLIRHYL